MNNQDKEFTSLFVPEQKINLPNYITEQLLFNWMNICKRKIPNSPFWRKEICENNDYLTWLRGKYIAELSSINELILVFNPTVLLKFIKNNRIITIKFMKREEKLNMILKLFKEQASYVKELKKSNKSVEKTENIEKIAKPFKTTKSNISL